MNDIMRPPTSQFRHYIEGIRLAKADDAPTIDDSDPSSWSQPQPGQKKRMSSKNWSIVRSSVLVREDRKNDLWDQVMRALGEKPSDETKDDDLSDTVGIYTFADFHTQLDLLRRRNDKVEANGDATVMKAAAGEEKLKSDHEGEVNRRLGFTRSMARVGISNSLTSFQSYRRRSSALTDDSIEEEEASVNLHSIHEAGDDPFGDDMAGRKPIMARSVRRRGGSIVQTSLGASAVIRSKQIFNSSGCEELGELLQLRKAESFKDWARSFYHLDPRWQILHFFNDVALEGIDKVEDMGGIIPADKRLETPCLLRAFTRAGVFSVWRPTSNDAIKKMMTGEGVGKGLDIKGKSALKGKYSGFVPFMQIHKNEDKSKVTMTKTGRVRVFYPNQYSRDDAARLLALLLDEMVNKAKDSQKSIEDAEEMEAKVLAYAAQKVLKDLSPNQALTSTQMKSIVKESACVLSTGPMQAEKVKFQQALEDQSHNIMTDPRIYKIDDYASQEGVFGLDLPEKLFWEGFVLRNDITREDGSEEDTGRPSMPEFQAMNFDTLRKHKSKKGSHSGPRPVLYHGGCGSKQKPLEDSNPLCPLGLLMAYEEQKESSGKVTPVVSDFDCFLVGTRGVKFHEPLAEQELSMLNMCIDDIEAILSNPRKGENWTKRWLEVKKKHVNRNEFQEIPQFGYADPRSYTMMKGAVHRLRGNGAVRHGPECFNYGFPQDLDDKYLVISDTLPGQVPWKYVNSKELITILSEKIDEGFAFPMNPKWILCDDGWKQLYDKLLASNEPTVSESMNTWYPKNIQKRLSDISSEFPRGFVQCDKRSSGVAVDLAAFELNRYQKRRTCCMKLNKALVNDVRKSMAANPTLFSTTLQMLQIGKEADMNSKRDILDSYPSSDEDEEL